MEDDVVYRYSIGRDKEKVFWRRRAIDVSNFSPGDESQVWEIRIHTKSRHFYEVDVIKFKVVPVMLLIR